jgi:hypothetical protein
MPAPARDRQRMPSHSAGQDWLVSCHPPDDVLAGLPPATRVPNLTGQYRWVASQT